MFLLKNVLGKSTKVTLGDFGRATLANTKRRCIIARWTKAASECWLAYCGYSWDAVMGAIVPAVEPRVKVCVLALGGLDFNRSLPEVDTIDFVSRVKQPVLMLNGHYDFFFPVESTQEPFYRLLGSRKDQKRHLLYETGHNIPRNELIKHLGPVN